MRSLPITIVLVAAAGCSKKAPPAPTAGSAAPAPAPPPAPAPVRPSQGPLPQLPALDLADDSKRDAKIALGHALFFDTQLSAHNDRACYSCHRNEDGTGGHDPVAIGSGDKTLTRHAPVLWNVAYFKNAFYWDGRAKTLEDNAKGAWGGPNMDVGKDNLDKKAGEIAKLAGYKKLFAAAGFAAPNTADQVAQALAAYERTMICKDTRYDKYAAGDKSALTEQEQRGLDTFMTKGQCAVCHAPPYFSSAAGVDGGVYFNVGIGTGVAEDKVDIGRMKVSNAATDWAAFKPPTLRNITKSPPYFHDGSVAKLEDAVKLMSSGGIANKNKSALLADRNLSDAERADLIAFLGALDCPGQLEQPAAAPK